MTVLTQVNTIQREIKEATKRLAVLIDTLQAMIAELPDNPRINRLSKNCFTIRSKDLGNNWTPEHHDFKWQYNAIIVDLQNRGPMDAMSKLQAIIGSGKVHRPGSPVSPAYGNYVNLHPDVITNLRTLLELK